MNSIRNFYMFWLKQQTAFASLIILASTLFWAMSVQANDPSICYALADSNDRLVTIKRVSRHTFSDKGGAGTSTMEALTISTDGNTLYGAHIAGGVGFFGTLNVSTGAFTSISPAGGIGTGNGDQGPRAQASGKYAS